MRIIVLLLMLFSLAPQCALADAEPLGRLFLTPQERQALDRQRLRVPASSDGQGMIVNGEVRRSSGSRTRWINGRADWEGNTPAPSLPVGDGFDPATGQRLPLLGGGRIIVERPRQPH